MNPNTHTLISNSALESLKKMVEKLDADRTTCLKALEWIAANPFSHPGNVDAVAKKAIAKATE